MVDVNGREMILQEQQNEAPAPCCPFLHIVILVFFCSGVKTKWKRVKCFLESTRTPAITFGRGKPGGRHRHPGVCLLVRDDEPTDRTVSYDQTRRGLIVRSASINSPWALMAVPCALFC